MKKVLPAKITSYDLFKCMAVLLMLADHAGYYFFPEENWWRVFGRMCVPIWFFLVGYAKSRDLGLKMWIGAAILVGANFVVGMSIIPLNILASMLAVRLLIDEVMKGALRDERIFWGVVLTMFFLIIPTMFVVEYGTQGLILSVFGYMVRRRDELNISEKLLNRYFVAAFFMFVVPQFFFFGMTQAQFMVMGMGVMAVMGTLYKFKPAEFPRLTAALPGFVVAAIHFMGRRTMEIYVVHLLLFKFMGAFLEPERFVWFDWKWISATGT